MTYVSRRILTIKPKHKKMIYDYWEQALIQSNEALGETQNRPMEIREEEQPDVIITGVNRAPRAPRAPRTPRVLKRYRDSASTGGTEEIPTEVTSSVATCPECYRLQSHIHPGANAGAGFGHTTEGSTKVQARIKADILGTFRRKGLPKVLNILLTLR